MKKKLLCLTLALAMLLGLVACGNNNNAPADTNNPDAPPADTDTPNEPAETPEGFQPLTWIVPQTAFATGRGERRAERR